LKNRIFSSKKYLILILLIVFFVSYSALAIGKHLRFDTSEDLVIYGQSIWHYSRFEAPYSSVLTGIYENNGWHPNSSKGFNQLGDHFTPTLVFLAPFYWIYPSAISLLIAQALLVTLGVLPIWWLAKKKFGEIFAFVLSFAYLFFVGIQSGIDFNFHPEVIAATWIGFAIYFLLRKKFLLFFIFMFLALGSKEDISAIFAGLGIYLVLVKRWYKIGLSTFFISIVWFYMSAVLKVYFQTSTIQLLASNPKASRLFAQIISNPIQIFNVMFVPFYKIETIVTLFASFAFLPLASGLAWFTAPATFLNRFISDWARCSTHFQYSATIAPLLAISTILGIENFQRIFKKNGFKSIKTISIIAILVGTAWTNRPNWDPPFITPPLQLIFKRSFWTLSENQKTAHKLLKEIPSNVSVATNTFYIPHLMNSDKVFVFPWIIGEPDIYFLSTLDRYPFSTMGEFDKEIQKIKDNKKYELVFNQNGLLLFRKKFGKI
jgi:uncharacterized membrane protein